VSSIADIALLLLMACRSVLFFTYRREERGLDPGFACELDGGETLPRIYQGHLKALVSCGSIGAAPEGLSPFTKTPGQFLLELDLGLIQTHMAQKRVLWLEVGAHAVRKKPERRFKPLGPSQGAAALVLLNQSSQAHLNAQHALRLWEAAESPRTCPWRVRFSSI
jgi:hypothetical protein